MISPRVRVFELLEGAVMVTLYEARRPAELGHVGYIPTTPFVPTRPGGSAPS